MHDPQVFLFDYVPPELRMEVAKPFVVGYANCMATVAYLLRQGQLPKPRLVKQCAGIVPGVDKRCAGFLHLSITPTATIVSGFQQRSAQMCACLTKRNCRAPSTATAQRAGPFTTYLPAILRPRPQLRHQAHSSICSTSNLNQRLAPSSPPLQCLCRIPRARRAAGVRAGRHPGSLRGGA